MFKSSKRIVKAVAATLFLMATLLLSACGWEGVGTVVGKKYSEGHYNPVTYCSYYNTKGICSVWSIRQDWIPDAWYVVVSDSEGKNHTVRVTEGYYEAVENGDHFDNRTEN